MSVADLQSAHDQLAARLAAVELTEVDVQVLDEFARRTGLAVAALLDPEVFRWERGDGAPVGPPLSVTLDAEDAVDVWRRRADELVAAVAAVAPDAPISWLDADDGLVDATAGALARERTAEALRVAAAVGEGGATAG